MSQLKEILSIEQERSSLEQCAVIHLFPPFGRICNPPETNISICNAKKTAKNYVINIIDTRIVLYHFNRN